MRLLTRRVSHISLAGPLAAAVVLLLGCASTTLLSQLPFAEQVRYRGTEPGWHVLSPYFAIDVKPNGRATFYHFQNPQNPQARAAIGGQYVHWPTGALVTDKRKFGPRENAFAISEDGRCLLYFDEPPVRFLDPRRSKEGPPKPFGAALHLYRHGLGDSLIVSDVDHWWGPVGRNSLPPDAVVYSLPDRKAGRWRALWTHGETVVRSTAEFNPR